MLASNLEAIRLKDGIVAAMGLVGKDVCRVLLYSRVPTADMPGSHLKKQPWG